MNSTTKSRSTAMTANFVHMSHGCTATWRSLIALALWALLSAWFAPVQPAQAAADNCGLVVEIIAAPFAAVDSNKPGVDGPRVALLGARIANSSSLPIKDVSVSFSSTALAVLNSSTKSYFLNDLQPGSSVTAYWPVTYPATYGVSYPYTIAVSAPGGCSASSSSQITTQSEIGATSNKLLPTGSTVSVTPSVVTLGSLVTIRITGFTLGTVGQGPKGAYDAWMQPLGNTDFDSSCLRLVRSEVKLASVSATPFIDRLYFTNLRSYQANPSDYVAYTFIALQPCTAKIQPYQEAASGTQEKYNADYSALASRIGMTTTNATTLQITVQPDRTMVKANDVVSYAIEYASPGAPVGYPSNGNPAVIYSEIPKQTGYVAGSATETADADAEFSGDGGSTWVSTEPTDPGKVTDVRWLLNAPVDSTPRQVKLAVAVDSNYTGAPILLPVSGTLYDGPTLTAASSTVTDAAANSAPVANDDSTKTNMGTAVTIPVVANDTDADGNFVPSSAVSTSNPSYGGLGNKGDGSFIYTPSLGYIGTDSFTYSVCDNQGACDSASVVVYVGQEQLHWQSDSKYIAFEDMKNTDWSDWDYNDFVVRIDARTGIDNAGRIVTMEIDYDTLARGAGYAQRFVHNLPIEGGGVAMLSVFDSAGKLLGQRTSTFDSNTNITIFDRTRDALPPLTGFFDTNTKSSQPGVVPGWKAKLTIFVANPDANLAVALPPAPWDPYVYVYYTRQEIHLLVPGHMDNTQVVNPKHDAASPLVGYDLPLAQTFSAGWRWPEEFSGIWRGFPQYASYVGSGGTTNLDWWKPENSEPKWLWTPGANAAMLAAAADAAATTPIVTSRYFAGPVAADLNGDGWNEIIAGNLLANRVEVINVLGGQVVGWPQLVDGGVKSAALVTDLDADGQPEVLAGTESGQLYAWHYNGRAVAGWPVVLHAGFRVLATPAVGDLDGDGGSDIVVPVSDGKLYALDSAGNLRPGWPVSIGDVADLFGSQVINSSPRIADLDGDGSNEVIVGSTDKRVYVFNRDGAQRWVYPTGDMVLSTPAIGEIDPASPGLEIVVGSGDRYVYLLDNGGNLIWRRPTGWIVRSSPIIADLDGDQSPEIIIGSDDDKVWAWHTDGKLVSGWPAATGADILSSPRVGDVDNDGRLDVIVGSDDAKVWAWHADGSLINGWPRSMNLSIKGAPLLANLDDDATLEVAAADLSGTIQKWNIDTVSFRMPVFLPSVLRGD